MDNLSIFNGIVKSKNYTEAVDFQKQLSDLVICDDSFANIRTICAFDVSYNKYNDRNYVAAVTTGYPDLDILDKSYLIRKSKFPYIPGLLSFREGPAILALYNRLSIKPDLLLFDGHGLAHPRGMGIASMMGVLLDKPSIGSAKTKLVGEYIEPGAGKGSYSSLTHNDKEIGYILRSRQNVKPIFVSIGHRISLMTACEIVLKCCVKYRLPEPIREAHNYANLIRRKYQD